MFKDTLFMLEKAPRKMRVKGTQTKALVLETAVQVFAKKSYHNTTVEDVARAAGLAKGTLYQYFRSKKELLGACVDLWQQNMDLHAEQKLQDIDLSSAEAFRGFLRQSFLDFFEAYAKNLTVLRVLCKASEESLPIEATIEQGFNRIVKSYERVLAQGHSALLVHSDLSAFQNAFFLASLLYQVAYQNFMVEKKEAAQAPIAAMDSFMASALKIA